MPASPCRTYTDPEERAAWLALEAAEVKLEKFLRNADGATASLRGHVYFIDENRMLCAPAYTDGGYDKEHSFHRDDYEGQSAQDMRELTQEINDWFATNSLS